MLLTSEALPLCLHAQLLQWKEIQLPLLQIWHVPHTIVLQQAALRAHQVVGLRTLLLLLSSL